MKQIKSINRYLAIILSLCMIVLSVSVVSATEISPRYTGMATIACELDINSNGYASCSGRSLCYVGYTANVTLELQQKDGSWDTIKSWTGSGRSVPFDKGYFVASGYDYRVKITSVVYDVNGNYIETVSATTGVHSY